jgi:hypothetical protein
VDAPLPADLPTTFYFQLHSYLQCGRYADRLQPWIKEFGRDRWAEPISTVQHGVHSQCWQQALTQMPLPVLQPALRLGKYLHSRNSLSCFSCQHVHVCKEVFLCAELLLPAPTPLPPPKQ